MLKSVLMVFFFSFWWITHVWSAWYRFDFVILKSWLLFLAAALWTGWFLSRAFLVLTDCCQFLPGKPYYLCSVCYDPGGVPLGPPARDGLQCRALQPVSQAVQVGLRLCLPLRSWKRTNAEGRVRPRPRVVFGGFFGRCCFFNTFHLEQKLEWLFIFPNTIILMFATSWSQVWETLQVFQSRAAPGCLLTQDEHVRTLTSRACQ